MSENGEYTMTEDGPTWKAQAEALAKALIENQSLSFLTTDAEGKTDAVTGVSISVNGFIDLATQCLEQASGIEVAEPEATEAPAEEEAPASAEGTHDRRCFRRYQIFYRSSKRNQRRIITSYRQLNKKTEESL